MDLVTVVKGQNLKIMAVLNIIQVEKTLEVSAAKSVIAEKLPMSPDAGLKLIKITDHTGTLTFEDGIDGPAPEIGQGGRTDLDFTVRDTKEFLKFLMKEEINFRVKGT